MKRLTDAIEFDAPFRVHEDGTISHEHGVYAPELFDEHLMASDTWELLNGYSGQSSYSGPIMHNSEYIGGQLERDILATPGIYCVIAAFWSSEPDESKDFEVEGWAVARLKES